ncbi:imidazole glycerol phosphate synthase subunit HisH [Helicobacter sp. MIT 00-7814]|uniref:imidazole glycerol phosphate synthase subunit HisH n=1 Tax=unclassified Helicobacter TaxID=2593540 RepID=UPI000E1ECFE6|nr:MULTISPECIES: imidazole glycerol phosphate synthase subunit HisH [unclassified Helicobacter]RDU57205.1 imidazole glycerol phosphate synthase subunit HisH [Helicobacter sp. MIT 00-7814]RDU57757.1 imidazole glycerol phosphate synthase subunit HisH [Helicobacter sp. MIT 99-10781]
MYIGILNYNIGNLASVQNALNNVAQEFSNITISVESDPCKIVKFDKIILPGVGAFGDAIAHLRQNGLDEAICSFAKSGKYLLGICLGMQLLLQKSYEFGEHSGLGLIEGEVVEFDKARLLAKSTESNVLKIPQIGWNKCILSESGAKNGLFNDCEKEFFLYFVHSFHASKVTDSHTLARCEYGYSFPAIIGKDNILGIQPHPEKSHKMGLKLLKNFIAL